jgi:ArsR family transcriptional regulator
MSKHSIEVDSLDRTTRLLRAFGDPVRLRILSLLTVEPEVRVSHLHEALGLPQPTVSRHLSHLREQGLVVGRKDWFWVHYRLASPETDLHRSLIGCVLNSMNEVDVFRKDRERLMRVVGDRTGI